MRKNFTAFEIALKDWKQRVRTVLEFGEDVGVVNVGVRGLMWE